LFGTLSKAKSQERKNGYFLLGKIYWRQHKQPVRQLEPRLVEQLSQLGSHTNMIGLFIKTVLIFINTLT